MRKLFLLLAAIPLLIVIGCSPEDTETNINLTVSTGAYILSEGSTSPGSAKLSFYNSFSGAFTQSIFNPGTLGLFPDGMIKYNGNLFITEQGNYNSAGKIYKLDTAGKVLSQNSVGKNPYSLCASNNKIYITNGPAGNVSVVDPNTLSTLKEITAGVYPQEIIAHNGFVYVCNTGVYNGDQDSTVSIIDASTDAVIKTLNVSKDPSSLVVTGGNKLFVGCPGISGKLYVFDLANNNLVFSKTLFNGFSKDMVYDSKTDVIYFVANNGDIIKMNPSTYNEEKLIGVPSSGYVYGYAYDSGNLLHYIADARNFIVTGLVYVCNGQGVPIDTLSTGIAPRRILINK
ncbi:MAG: YncE family protein [Ignavibacteria bacterium]|nr:YncE family protein [Ignavibacteria bacterium]